MQIFFFAYARNLITFIQKSLWCLLNRMAVFSLSVESRNLDIVSINDPFPKTIGHCDEWDGAESRGNGARPVE